MSINVVLKSIFDDRGIREAERAFDKLGKGVDKAFNALAVGAGVAAIGVAKFGGDAIKAASDLEESTNAVNVSFLAAADAVLAIGENSADALGLARTEFNQAAVRFSAFASRVVGEGGDVAGFIGDITQRAADFASVFNIDVAEALQVFQSGLAGEAEPLKRFGINLLESEVKAYALRAGIISVGESMDETQKVQARYGLLLESTAKTAGDFANTSDGLANSQRILRARFTDLQAEIGNALLPVVTELFQAFGDKLLPKLEELGEFLASPQGQKMIEDTADSFMNFFEAVVDNIDEIIDFTIKVAAAVAGLKILKTALELATVAQNLLNAAVLRNPYVIAATALVALAGGMALVFDHAQKVSEEANRQAENVGNLQEEIRRLDEAFEDGLIPQDKYQAKLEQLQQRIIDVGGSIEGTAGELNRFNNLRVAPKLDLSSWQEEINRVDTSSIAGILEASGFSSIDELLGGDEGGGGGGGGPTPFERAQEFVKSAQKDLLTAQQRLNKGLEDARNRYAQGVLRTEREFADKLAGIVQQSQDRLRSAFANVVRVSLADIFARTDEEGVVTKSVDNLIDSLRTKLEQSRRLISQTSSLAALGFSQTFIEQVTAAGTETGNELAQAILNSTPETQEELRSLFSAVESTAETGMDSLAQRIYEQQGLATTELVKLYETTQDELNQALLELRQQLNDDIIDANQAFVDAVKDIRQQLQEQIAGIEGDFSRMARTLQQFYDKLNRLQGGAGAIAAGATSQELDIAGAAGLVGGTTAAISELSGAVGVFIDNASDLTAVSNYLSERISRAESFARNIGDPRQAESALAIAESFRQQQAGLGATAVGTTININVKTDSTQSVAMVGKTLGNTINKYVTAGGQVLVSPT